MTKYSALLSPVKVGALDAQNRIVLSAMTRARAPNMLPNELLAEYYCQRAAAGFMITEGTFISELGIGWVDVPGIHTKDQVLCWKRVTDAVHERGGKLVCQLWHCGRQSHAVFRPTMVDPRPVAPSPIGLAPHKHYNTPVGVKTYEEPRELTTAQCRELVEEFRHAAACAKEAGFDGVEIHGANGYILDTFLQSCSNKRTDEYGGSFENRFRIVREVIEAILTVWDADRVGIKLSPNGVYGGMGSEDFRESFRYYLEELAKFELAFVEVMSGLGFGFHNLGEPMTIKEIRGIYPGVLVANCGYNPETANADIDAGYADLVSFGRLYISNPDLVERLTKDVELEPESADKDSWWRAGSGPVGYTDYPIKTSTSEGQ